MPADGCVAAWAVWSAVPCCGRIVQRTRRVCAEMLKSSAIDKCRQLLLSVVQAERLGESAPNRGMLKGLTNMMVDIGV